MKTKTTKMLPKTSRGSVHAQFVRCGKQGCRCAKGELHGAYFYHFVRVDGKLRKRYLKPAEVPVVRRACQLRRHEEKLRSAGLTAAWKRIRDLREQIREARGVM